MKNHIISHTVYSILIAFTVLLSESCSEENVDFTLGQDLLESKTNLIRTDTFTVNLSTVIIDSLPSSLIDTILVGNYQDNIFGRVSCNSYFEIGLPSATSVNNDDIYDSLSIILWPTGYSYGDTLNNIYFSLHRLSEKLESRESGNLYSTSSFGYLEEELGGKIFQPKPTLAEPIYIKLKDELGLELFTMMKDNDERMESDEAFLSYFKGLVLLGDTSYNSSVLGLYASDTTVIVRLYTHRIGETTEDIEYDFSLINPEQQFNEIKHDFSSTHLENVTSQKNAVRSDLMDGKAYTQGGVGLMTKVEFPYFNEYLLFENTFLLKAELIIRPAKASYNTFEIPESIYLYNTGKNNTMGDVLYDADGIIITPSFVLDDLFNEETSYTFDITNYLKLELADNYFDTEHGLLISFSYEEYLCSLKRLVLETEDNAATLRICSVKY